MSVLLAVGGPLESDILLELAHATPPIEVVRRCADHAEVLGAARAGLGSVAVVEDADLAFIDDLHKCGVRVLGVCAQGAARNRGFDAICSPVGSEVRACLGDLLADPLPTREQVSVPEREGRLVAVWGTHGAPGRSAVARDLAALLAAPKTHEVKNPDVSRRRRRFPVGRWRRKRAGEAPAGSVLLVDADTVSPSLAQLLSLNQESSALAVAARKINLGESNAALIADLAVPVAGFDFLAGFNKGSRWREFPEPVAREFFTQVKRGWDYIVADCGAGAERSDYGYDADRDGATLELLEAADDIVVVGKATPIGIRRLLERLEEAADMAPNPLHVVVTQLRPGAFSAAEQEEIAGLLEEKGVRDALWIREDRARYAQAELRGLTLPELNPACQAVSALAELATRLRTPARAVAEEPVRAGVGAEGLAPVVA